MPEEPIRRRWRTIPGMERWKAPPALLPEAAARPPPVPIGLPPAAYGQGLQNSIFTDGGGQCFQRRRIENLPRLRRVGRNTLNGQHKNPLFQLHENASFLFSYILQISTEKRIPFSSNIKKKQKKSEERFQ